MFWGCRIIKSLMMLRLVRPAVADVEENKPMKVTLGEGNAASTSPSTSRKYQPQSGALVCYEKTTSRGGWSWCSFWNVTKARTITGLAPAVSSSSCFLRLSSSFSGDTFYTRTRTQKAIFYSGLAQWTVPRLLRETPISGSGLQLHVLYHMPSNLCLAND